MNRLTQYLKKRWCYRNKQKNHAEYQEYWLTIKKEIKRHKEKHKLGKETNKN